MRFTPNVKYSAVPTNGASQISPTQPIAARESRFVKTTWPDATTTTKPCTTTITQGQTVVKNPLISSAIGTNYVLTNSPLTPRLLRRPFPSPTG